MKTIYEIISKFFFSIIIIYFLKFSLTKTKKKPEKVEFEYFACFCTKIRQENLYVRDLISYYLGIGFQKFILGDNNLPDQEKLTDVIQDYINNGTVDMFEIFGSAIGQGEFFQFVYEKYKTKCEWISFFDIDEYLKMYSVDNKTINIKEYLNNPVFSQCETISINWLIYSDNNLLYYDNRSVLERFTAPNYDDIDNTFVKSIVRGNLNKVIFYPGKSNHFPDKRIIRCNSNGRRLKFHDYYSVKPPVFKYAYLMHYNTKTVEEYVKKIKRGANRNGAYDINERIYRFFTHNMFTEEKLNLFEKAFNRTFDEFHHHDQDHDFCKNVSIKNIWLFLFIFWFLM